MASRFDLKSMALNENPATMMAMPRAIFHVMEDGGSEAHGDNRFDEEGVGSVGSAVCFDSSHEAQVSEAGDDDAGIEQDADRIGADAFDDRFVECDEDDEFEEGAE